MAGRGRRGGKNSRERQGSVLTLRGEAGYGRFRDKTYGKLPRVHLWNVRGSKAAVVSRLQRCWPGKCC